MNADASSAAELQLADCAALVESDPEFAAARLREFLAANPLNADAYRLLARADDSIAETKPASVGIKSRVVSGAKSRLEHAARALNANDRQTAEIILRKHLLERPADVEALYLMAKLADSLNFELESEKLLRLVLEFAHNFTPARIELARLLDKRHRPLEACKELEHVLAREPDNLFAKAVQAAALGRSGQYAEAAKLYEELLRKVPNEPALWTTYGNILKTMGRADHGVQALRQATKLAPDSGEAWWHLSNVKTGHFDAADIASMRAALGRHDLGEYDRFHLHFALGKAYEDVGDAAEAFAQYDHANAIRRRSSNYQHEAIRAEVDASVRLFSRKFFEARIGSGVADRDPIFILGMPRAGSTLIEQILASHPEVEGTKELPNIPIIGQELGRSSSDYFCRIAALDHTQLRVLGERYLELSRFQRMSDRPYFVDKMPNNWLQIPLIHLLLPHAKIIDARRHPLACGYSNFKQNYSKGHSWSYDLTSIGSYYREYVRLLAHIDSALPGRVHRIFHERLVEDTEGVIRRLLDYLELPFDSACLRFYETDRAVRTPSAEQVRRPISRSGVDQWRMFEPWLGPLKIALGPVLDAYPDVPDFRSE